MVDFTANDIVLLIGAISGGVCAIVKLSRCEQINICGFLAFKRRNDIKETPAPPPTTPTEPSLTPSNSMENLNCVNV